MLGLVIITFFLYGKRAAEAWRDSGPNWTEARPPVGTPALTDLMLACLIALALNRQGMPSYARDEVSAVLEALGKTASVLQFLMPAMCCSMSTAKVSESGLLGLSKIVAQVIQTDPYLMAGPRWASHMLDQGGEQVLTDHLRIGERQGHEMGLG